MLHDLSDLGSLILIQITPKERTITEDEGWEKRLMSQVSLSLFFDQSQLLKFQEGLKKPNGRLEFITYVESLLVQLKP